MVILPDLCVCILNIYLHPAGLLHRYWVNSVRHSGGNLTITGSDNGLSPDRHQAIIWTNAGILLIWPKFQWNMYRHSFILIDENTFEKVCEVAAILAWSQCVNGIMMTSSNGNIFRVTGHSCGEFTGPRWIPHTKASDAELWCLLWSASE